MCCVCSPWALWWERHSGTHVILKIKSCRPTVGPFIWHDFGPPKNTWKSNITIYIAAPNTQQYKRNNYNNNNNNKNSNNKNSNSNKSKLVSVASCHCMDEQLPPWLQLTDPMTQPQGMWPNIRCNPLNHIDQELTISTPWVHQKVCQVWVMFMSQQIPSSTHCPISQCP